MPLPLNYLIVHGSRSNPQRNWFPWLKNELEKTGGKVFVPAFPTPENQSLENWSKVADAAFTQCQPHNKVLIGHSTGSVFVLRLAERTTKPFKAVYSVCPFACNLGLTDYDAINATFIAPPFDWQCVRRGAERIVCFAGDDDPYVPLAYSQEIADHMGIRLHIVEKGGHLNAESGYLQFQLLLEKIRES